MLRFAEACEAIRATSKKTEKVRLVAEYLRSLPPDEAARAAVFFTGQAFPRFEEKVLSVGGSLMWQAVGSVAEAGAAAMEEVYRKHGDLGDVAEEVLAGKTTAEGISLAGVAEAFEKLVTLRGPSEKLSWLEQMLRRARPLEAKYLVKIATGDLRIGLKESLVEEAIALAWNKAFDTVQRANMLTGDISATLRLAAMDQLDGVRMRLFRPIGFMLASASETPAEIAKTFPEGALVEDKYDGIRAQAHKSGGEARLFSRTLDEITEFTELLAPLRTLPGDFILDGEIVAKRDGRALPFTELQQRLGRKQMDLFLSRDIPVSLVVFDLLYCDQEMLLDLPLVERRRRLTTLLSTPSGSAIQLAPQASVSSTGEIERAFESALARGNEGIMAKAPDSPYRPGRRGRYWLKLKRPMATLDVVVTAVEYGHGKRHGLLSDYTFSVRDGERLVTIGKAYSGLTDAEILELTEFFKQHTIEDQGFRRQVEPLVVLEVAFNNMQRSNRHESGYALRFPRIVRVRPDKPVSEIDTLDRVKGLYEGQFIGKE